PCQTERDQHGLFDPVMQCGKNAHFSRGFRFTLKFQHISNRLLKHPIQIFEFEVGTPFLVPSAKRPIGFHGQRKFAKTVFEITHDRPRWSMVHSRAGLTAPGRGSGHCVPAAPLASTEKLSAWSSWK